jgi:D-beta-D-heptose 7-phosphate kinase / D-beta-D-heptose 1-phosphate adenosyltransferase
MIAGGAANVALNVRGLRAQCMLAGVVGRDSAGDQLKILLNEQGVDIQGIVTAQDRPTTCKTRVVSGNHQIVRLDEEETGDLRDDLSAELLTQIHWLLREKPKAVIISDYGKGVLGESLVIKIIQECRLSGIPVLVDPKRSHYTPYAHATCITPNQKEFHVAVNAMGIQGDDLLNTGRQLREAVDCGTLLVTQGANGMTLITSEQSHHFPALAQEVYDVSGAGDTVIAVLATALGIGIDLVGAVRLANMAASIVVRRAGTSPICWLSLSELLRAQDARSDHSSYPKLRSKAPSQPSVAAS